MEIKNLAGRVNSLYQTSKDIIRNPKRLAVPIALGLALSYAPRTNAGTISDTFADGIWNYNNAFTVTYGIITDNEEHSDLVELRRENSTFEVIRFITNSYSGSQTLEATFNEIPPDNWSSYYIMIEASDNDYAYVEYINVDGIFYFNFQDDIEQINYITANPISTLSLKLIKDSSGNITAYAKEDNNSYQQIPGVTNVADLTTGQVRCTFESQLPGKVYELTDLSFTGENVPDINNNNNQMPLIPLNALTNLPLEIIIALLGSYLIKKRNNKLSII